MVCTKDEKTILALDQSSGLTGYSVFKGDKLLSYGVFDISDITRKTNGDTYYNEKVENVKLFLDKCIDFFKPQLVIFEDTQRQANVMTFKQLSSLQGVLTNYCYCNSMPFAILKPSEWRGELKIKGNKRDVIKKNTQDFIKNTFDIEVGEDEADAISIGLASKRMLNKSKLIIYKEI